MTDNLPRPIISEVGESALLVSWGNRVSRRNNDRAHAMAAWYRNSQAGEAVDLVPGYSSLLVVFDSLRIDGLAMRRRLQSGIEAIEQQQAGNAAPGREHVVPVQYGGEAGPDLEELAGEEGCQPRDIIASHTSRPFRVAFLGFLPGFAYMGRLPRRSPISRRATPRLRVPAGSVGLAGYQTGIYPFSSPGGWRIIGRAGVSVWDLDTVPPARFAPGDTVRFVESQ
jgi:KipI family sensor histidine kinase inhibitor